MCSPEGAKLAAERALAQVKGTGNPVAPLADITHLVGAWLAREGSSTVCLSPRGVCIASKPAPTGSGQQTLTDRSPVTDQVHQVALPVELEVTTGTGFAAEQNHFIG